MHHRNVRFFPSSLLVQARLHGASRQCACRWRKECSFYSLLFTPSPVTQTETAPPGLSPEIQSPFFFICFAAICFFVVIRAIVHTSFASTHNTTKAAGSPEKAEKLAIKYQSYCRLYQNPVTMIHLVLNDLRRPARQIITIFVS